MKKPPDPSPPPNQYGLQLRARGRLVLPSAVRKQLELKPGDRLVLTVDPESKEMYLVSLNQVVEKFCGILAGSTPGRVWSDELIAERRLEAFREDRE